MKMTTQMCVFMEYDWDWRSSEMGKKWLPKVWSCRVSDNENRVFISEHQISVDIPDDFDPVPNQVAALEKQKLAALATYQQAVAEINERLSKLQAIECAP